jgi:anti-sigma factor RsiW
MLHEECGHLLNELSAYLDGEASAAICTEIEGHLCDCGDCRVVVDTLRKTVLLYHELPKPSLPSKARERLYKKLDLAEFLAP